MAPLTLGGGDVVDLLKGRLDLGRLLLSLGSGSDDVGLGGPGGGGASRAGHGLEFGVGEKFLPSWQPSFL